MKPSVCIQHIVLTFFFLFFIGQKGAVMLAKIKPLPDTTVICSGKGFYLLTFFSLGHSIKTYFSFSEDVVLLILLLS